MEPEAAVCLMLVLLGGLAIGAVSGLFPAITGVLRGRFRDGCLCMAACLFSGLLFGALLAVPAAVLLTVAIDRRAHIRWLRVSKIVGIFILIGIATFLLFRLFSGDPVVLSKETTCLTEPLDEDGCVDYLTVVNERYSQGITAENNAAVVVWQVLGPPPEVRGQVATWFEAMGMRPLPDDGDYWQPYADFRDDADPAPLKARRELLFQTTRVPWDEQRRPLVAEWLRANQQHLDRIREATRRPRYFTPKIADPDLPVLPAAPSLENEVFRELSDALRARAMFRAKHGDFEGTWEDLLACRRFGQLVGQGPTAMDAAIQATVIRRVASSLTGLAEHGQLSRSQAQRILQDLAAQPPLRHSAEQHDVWGRYCVLDGIARIARLGPLKASRPELDRTQTLTNAAARFCYNSCVDWDEMLREANSLVDQAVDGIRESDLKKRRMKLRQFNENIRKIRDRSDFHSEGALWREFLMGCGFGAGRAPVLVSRQAWYLLPILMPNPLLDSMSEWNMQVDDRLAVLAIALAAHHEEHGAYPEALDALTPQYVEELPTDPWSGRPFRYRREGEGFVLYSVSFDGQDNGGVEYEERGYGDCDIVVRVPSKSTPDF